MGACSPVSEPGAVRINQSDLSISLQEAADGEVRGCNYGLGTNLGEVCHAAVAGIGYTIIMLLTYMELQTSNLYLLL